MRNISIKKYIQLKEPQKYSVLLHSKPCSKFGKYESTIDDMTYDQVKSVVRSLKQMKSWEDVSDIFETIYNITQKQFFKSKIKDFFAAKKYIIHRFKQIVETENKLLKTISKDYGKFLAAGGERLNRFSDVLPLNQLGKIYGIYPFDLKDYKYKEILLLLTIEKEQSELNEKMYGLS